ncbi:uncharacterized protein LOC116180175 [Photinus pyralis]|uniref:uncharacterized protein LOC116180175 n=1 Tax=Photinus pyralis TaxID=7054 RepID=UPI0012672C0F|nr:uncharacterized protein LOC116180175 [Photinus pyralis]
MFAKLAILFVAVAAVSAGYLEPAVIPSVRTYVQHTPIAIPQPPITYSVPPTARADHLPPVVTSSYGFSTSHIPGPAPILRAHHPVAAAPLLGHEFGLARGYAAGYGFGGHYAAAPLALGRAFASPLSYARSSYAAPTFGYAAGAVAAPFGLARGYGW